MESKSSDQPASTVAKIPNCCPLHPDRPVRYVCLDTTCSEKSLCCILCIKNKHQNCDDKLIIERGVLPDKILLKNVSGGEMENFKEDVRKILQEMHAYLTQKYKKYMSESLNYIGSDTMTLAQLASEETIKGLKENCNIKLDANGKVEVCPKIDPSKPTIGEDMRSFKEDIRAVVDAFARDLNDVRFTSANSMNLGDFAWHKNLGKINRRPRDQGPRDTFKAQGGHFGDELLHDGQQEADGGLQAQGYDLGHLCFGPLP